jgi:polynucleotide 5'-kinase involved in rRNA processing
MDQKNGKDSAIPFIVNKDGEFSVSEESKIFLRTLHGKKVGVVCVVGKYRTGKSYFLNKVILNRATESGFNVGPTVNPCTKVSSL